MFQKFTFTGVVMDPPILENDHLHFWVESNRLLVDKDNKLTCQKFYFFVRDTGKNHQTTATKMKAGSLIGIRYGVFRAVDGYPPIPGPENNQANYILEARNTSVLMEKPPKGIEAREDIMSLILAGYLGQDAEARYTPGGSLVLNMSMAVNLQRGKDDEGNFINETSWWRLSVWNESAERLLSQKIAVKGAPFLVEATLSPDPATGCPKMYTAKDGTLRASFDAYVNTIRYLKKRESAPVYDKPAVEQDGEIPF